MEKRTVRLIKYEKIGVDDSGRGVYENILSDEEAVWTGWGIDYFNEPTGPGPFTAGIIEFADGSVQMVPPARFKFVEPVLGHCFECGRPVAIHNINSLFGIDRHKRAVTVCSADCQEKLHGRTDHE